MVKALVLYNSRQPMNMTRNSALRVPSHYFSVRHRLSSSRPIPSLTTATSKLLSRYNIPCVHISPWKQIQQIAQFASSCQGTKGESVHSNTFVKSSGSEPNIGLPDVTLEKIESHVAMMESWTCSGCGIPLQYQHPSKLGYVPLEHLRGLDTNLFIGLQKVSCERCFRMKSYGKFRVQRQLSYPFFSNHVRKHLKENENLMLLHLVDILDIRGSFQPALEKVFGNDRPVMLVVNKGDLVPERSGLRRLLRYIRQQAKLAGLQNIVAVYLVSALKGIGMHEIVRDLKKFRKGRDVCVIGAANVGKSTFLNSLLSYLTTRKWKHNHRKYMKLPAVSLEDLEDDNSAAMLNIVKDNTGNVPVDESTAGQSPDAGSKEGGLVEELRGELAVKYHLEENEDPLKLEMATEHEDRELTISPLPGTTLAIQNIPVVANNELFCIVDTPGLIVESKRQKLIEILAADTANALKNVFPTKRLPLSVYCLSPGQTLFLGALARFDYVSQQKPTSNKDRLLFAWYGVLPGHVTKTLNADATYVNHAGGLLSPPRGLDALSLIGPLKSSTRVLLHEHLIQDHGRKSKDARKPKRTSLLELVVPSFGWCTVAAVDLDGSESLRRTVSDAKIEVSTCEGLTIETRTPLYPYELSDSKRATWK